MSTAIFSLLNEDITVWARASTGAYGAPSFSGPTVLKGRWENRSERAVGASGREFVSIARAIVESQVNIGDMAAKGSFTETDPTQVASALTVEIAEDAALPSSRATIYQITM